MCMGMDNPYTSLLSIVKGEADRRNLTVQPAPFIYPNNPHPNDAVHRMENTTSMIIHMSSFFMGLASYSVCAFRLL